MHLTINGLPDVVAFTYDAANYDPVCMRRMAANVVEAIGINSEFASLEGLLHDWSASINIDMWDEESYDSGDFPKLVFADQLQPGETCGKCGEVIEP